MNRKAIGWSTVAALILGLAFLLVILIFLFKIGTKSNSIVEDSECKSSIMSHYVINEVSGEALVSEIYCPTRYYTIPGKNDDETKKQLADALKSCWGTWGRGELNLFKDEGYYCHICSVIDFKKKDESITGFVDYLVDTPIDERDGITYFDYLTAYSSEKASPDFAEAYKEQSSQATIDTSKTYAVMFLYAKGDKFIKKTLEGIGSLTTLGASDSTTVGGAVIGGGTGILIGLGVAQGSAALASAIGVSALVPGVGWFVAGGLAIGAGVGAVIGWLQSKEVQWYALPLFYEYNEEALKKMDCGISPARQDKVQKALG